MRGSVEAIRNRGKIVSNLTFSVVLVFAASTAAFATINVNPSTVGFASQTVGTTSPPRSVTLTNLNTDGIEIVRVSCSLPQFSYSGPPLPILLHPGQSLVSAVVFRPSSVQTYSGTLVFTRFNGSTVTVPLSGVGIVSPSIVTPSISVQPANQSVVAGQTANFSVAASGTAPLSYQWQKNGIAISGATSASYATPAATTSDNGAQFTVLVSNSAGRVTSAPATLTVAAPGTLMSSSSALNFGSMNVGTSSILSATLTNSGGSSVTVSNVSLAGSGFNASGISTGQIIGVGQKATMNVTFAPAASGSVTGGITIRSNASNSTTTISLSGTGVTASHSVGLSWIASTSNVIGYNVYRSTTSGGSYIKLNPTAVSTTNYLDAGVVAGQTYYYVVTAVNSSNIQSVYSNQISGTIP